MKAIGPSFATELRAAGVSPDGIAWGSDGQITYRDDVSQAVRDQVAAVYAAHDPTAPGPSPAPTPREWLERLSMATQLGLETAALANASVSLWLRKATGAGSIDVTLQETKDGVAAMVAAGLLTAAEQTTLLAP
jgi:hypothetical protein